jgi:hypothetical protein
LLESGDVVAVGCDVGVAASVAVVYTAIGAEGGVACVVFVGRAVLLEITKAKEISQSVLALIRSFMRSIGQGNIGGAQVIRSENEKEKRERTFLPPSSDNPARDKYC